MTLLSLPLIEPTEAIAGDTWQWQKSLADYPISDGWVLSYGINGPKAVGWTPGWATNDGTTWTVVIPKASTSPLTPGSYEVTAILTGSVAGTGASNGMRESFRLPQLVVLPDPAAQADGTRVSHAAKVLPLIEAAIEGRVPADMQHYMIHGREITKIPILDLRRLRRVYRAELWRENNPTKTAPTRKVRFAPV